MRAIKQRLKVYVLYANYIHNNSIIKKSVYVRGTSLDFYPTKDFQLVTILHKFLGKFSAVTTTITFCVIFSEVVYVVMA